MACLKAKAKEKYLQYVLDEYWRFLPWKYFVILVKSILDNKMITKTFFRISSIIPCLLCLAISFAREINKFSCNFEDPDTCQWTQDKSDDSDWTRNQAFTPAEGTGPHTDHTKGLASGWYFYIETSSPREPNDKARLISPSTTKAKSCLLFFYHMYGRDVGKLQVYVKSEGKMYSMWSLSGDQGKEWHRAQVAVNNQKASYQFVIEGVRGESIYGDIAIDDISLMDSCPRENQLSKQTSIDNNVSTTPAISPSKTSSEESQTSKPSVNNNGSKKVTTTFTVSTTPAISPSQTTCCSEENQPSKSTVNNNGSKKVTTTFTVSTTPAILPSQTNFEENQPSKSTVNNNGSKKITTTFTVSTTPAFLPSQTNSEDKGTMDDSSRIIIIATTVGAGVFLSIVLNIVVLVKYKRRKRAPKLSSLVNIPLEANEISPEPLPVDEEALYETMGEFYDNFGTSGSESEDPSAKGRALLYDWIGVPSNGDKTSGYETPVEPGNETVARVNGGFYNDVATNANASEDISSEGRTSDHEEVEVPSNAHQASGNTELNKRPDTLKRVATGDGGYRAFLKEVDIIDIYIIPLPEEPQHETSGQNETCEEPKLSPENPVYTELDVKGRNATENDTYQKLVKQDSDYVIPAHERRESYEDI